MCSGDHHSPDMMVWNAVDYSLLTATCLSSPIHDVCWDHHTAYELSSVGAGGHIAFWLLEGREGDSEQAVELKVRREREIVRLSESVVVCISLHRFTIPKYLKS